MKNYFNLTLKVTLLVLIGLLSYSCSKDDPTPPPPIVIDPGDGDDDSFIALDPNFNDGVVDFESTGPSFDAENQKTESNLNGTWGIFGGKDGNDISIEYADNPSKSGINTSDRVVKISEPTGIWWWAGFFFNLEEEINFPEGKEAISIQFYSPGAGHQVGIKLEDQLEGEDDNKLTTPDLTATTEGTGWETLIFNVPEIDGERDGIYNRFTMIAGYQLDNEEPVEYFFDNINFAEPKEVVIPDDPTTAPEAPTAPEAQVISIFSDAYTNIEGTNFNPNWGQSTVVTTETIAENTVLKYSNLNYQGTDLSPELDVSGKTKLHLDYFTGNATALKFYLINPGNPAVEKAYELNVSDNPGTWNSVDIDLTHFSDVVDLTKIGQFKVEGNGIVYFDNIYFYGVNSAPSAAPAAPDKEASDVISIYSDSYTAAVTPTLDPNWGQTTDATEVDLSGNSVLKYASLNYQGTDWADSPQDVSGMEYLHFDYWTAEASKFNFSIINVTEGKEKAYSPESVQLGQWVSVDVPLSYFSDVVPLTAIDQFKVDDKSSGEGATIYFDNFYFWKESTAPTTGPSAPTKDADEVLSVFSDSYTAAVTVNIDPDWGQATDATEIDLEGNKVLKYAGLTYQGTEWPAEEALDVSGMEYIHLDYWTADATVFNFSVISIADGTTLEKAYKIETTKGQWITVDIPLSEFSGVVNMSKIRQFKVDDAGSKEKATIYFDNLYFSK